MKLYTITVLITGPLLTERNFASVAGMFIGRLCHVGWHLGHWPVTLPPSSGENP